ncbi:hypothetical protein GCM10010300_78130 [Streptomyces olivaceoviridis]|nr:hypothetical protein GCM10010300_78130 [Streptomyces olivaceoviridis]
MVTMCRSTRGGRPITESTSSRHRSRSTSPYDTGLPSAFEKASAISVMSTVRGPVNSCACPTWGRGSRNTAATVRATSSTAIGEVRPAPNGSTIAGGRARRSNAQKDKGVGELDSTAEPGGQACARGAGSLHASGQVCAQCCDRDGPP